MATGEDANYLNATNFERDDNSRLDRLFKARHDNYKAGTSFKSDAIYPQKNIFQNKIYTKDEAFPTYTSQDLSFSLQHCCTIVPAEELWDGVTNFFDQSQFTDTETNSESKVIFGNYYKTPEDCTFLATVAKLEEGERSVVDIRRLKGNAFILTELVENMKDYLREVEDITILDDDDEDFSDDDSEEFLEENNNKNEIEGYELPNFEDCILEFEYDPELLHMMIDDFEKTHLENKNYSMSMLAHTSERKQNRELMLEGQWLEKVKKLVFNQLKSGKDLSDATLTRNTCVFLKNLVEDMEVDVECLNFVVKAMAEWCPGNEDSGRYIGCLQSSHQAMVEIDQIFAKIIKSGSFSEEFIANIIKEQLTKSELERVCLFEFESGIMAKL